MAIAKTGGDTANNIIGQNSYFTGTFLINGSLRIDGRFEGKFLQAEQLYIGPGGRIRTNINAVSVIVEGMIIGNITASSRVLLMPTARILGDIKTPELIIQNGVIQYSDANPQEFFSKWEKQFRKTNIISQWVGLGVGIIASLMNLPVIYKSGFAGWQLTHEKMNITGYVLLFWQIPFFYCIVTHIIFLLDLIYPRTIHKTHSENAV